jgi:hypothetical protein
MKKSKLKKYVVRLNVPTVMWAIVDVVAESETDAVNKAFSYNEKGLVEFEESGYDNLDAELTSVELA